MLKRWPRFLLAHISLSIVSAGLVSAQRPVFVPAIDIDQERLLQSCPIATDVHCYYHLKDLLNSGGDFWTTPFQPYDGKSGDGFGEGDYGPRSAQRAYFSPNNIHYKFLRLNGLDSQSCFECHNSTGSDVVDQRGALIRKASGVSGSAGGNSNAFINPLYPKPETLFIRNPPSVFGSGYTQAIAEEMSMVLMLEREAARKLARQSPGKSITARLVANGVDFGSFGTTYLKGSPASVNANPSICKAGIDNPLNIGGQDGYADDVRSIRGVSCDLVVRPFQWKGVASDLRHFVRDALDFHFSMQAFEKVGLCDCDMDGKGTSLDPKSPDRTEVTIGEVTAITSFVAMTRPPVQSFEDEHAENGHKIFADPHLCAMCHVESMRLRTPQVMVEWPLNTSYTPSSSAQTSRYWINPDDSTTWPITDLQCPDRKHPPTNACPVESTYSAATGTSSTSPMNMGTLIAPAMSSQDLSVVRRFRINIDKVDLSHPEQLLGQEPGHITTALDVAIRQLRSPIRSAVNQEAKSPRALGSDYVIPLTFANGEASRSLTSLQFPRLAENSDHTVDVPLFSDLKRHNMGSCLADPLSPLPAQGTDSVDIVNDPREYLTRPLWGVADTGPWLHDGRAMTLMEAILLHGDSKTCSGSEAAPVIDKFEKLSESDQQDVIKFLLTLRLPPPTEPPPSPAQ